MAYNALVSIFSPDRVGLISSVAACLYEMGADLGDTSFAVLGKGAEFTSICELPDAISPGEVQGALMALPDLEGAQVDVRRFDQAPLHGPMGDITHRIECEGKDQPGVVARLSEVFLEFGANIVRMNTVRRKGAEEGVFVTQFAVNIEPQKVKTCLATLKNTAAELKHDLRWEEVGG